MSNDLMLFPPNPDNLMSAMASLVSEYGYDVCMAELHMHAPPIPSAPARPTDPETSHQASKTMHDVAKFSLRSRQAKLLDAFYMSGPMTDQQAALKVVGDFTPVSSLEGCRRRMSDLRAAGLLMDTGERAHNEGSNDESIVWQLTLAGHRALDNLKRTGWSK